MSKGITAFVVVLSFTLAFSILVGLGVAGDLGVDYSSQYSDDAQSVLESIGSTQEASNTGGSAFTDFTVGGANTLKAAWLVLTNTSGVIQVLYGFPPVIADTIELLFRIVFGVTFAGFVRGVRLQ